MYLGLHQYTLTGLMRLVDDLPTLPVDYALTNHVRAQ